MLNGYMLRQYAKSYGEYIVITRAAIVITSLFTKLLDQVIAKQPFRFLRQALTCPTAYHTRRRLHIVFFIAERQAVNTN